MGKAMSSPRVLVIGRFHPDSYIRWLSDGLVYAGCRVQRCGIHINVNWPEEERPRLLDLPGYAPGLVTTSEVRVDLREIRQHFSERNFTTDLIVIEPWAGLALVPDGIVRPCAVRTATGQFIAVADGSTPQRSLSVAVDPYTYWFSTAPRQRRFIVGANKTNVVLESTILEFGGTLTFASLPLHVGAQVAWLHTMGAALVFDDQDVEFALRAVACGTPVIRIGEAAKEVLQFVTTLVTYETVSDFLRDHLRARSAAVDSSVHPNLCGVMTKHTWRHRAVELLDWFGLPPGPMPRL